MSSTYGENLRFTIFGQSHGPAIGVTVTGLPAGIPIDQEKLQAFLRRRAPGRSQTASPRREADVPSFLSGLVDGRTCGAPLTAVIQNTDARPQDYGWSCPRPGRGDFPAPAKFGGFQDTAGGGHLSGRLTAPLCIIGGICLQILAGMGVTVAAHIQAIAGVEDRPFDPVGVDAGLLRRLLDQPQPVLAEGVWPEMEGAILAAAGDSVGGIIECAAVGLPAGLGDPMFGGMENRIAQAVFGIPGIRGIEFGTGFPAAAMQGSRHNDPFYLDGGVIRTRTNHHGGILGGMTSGMPLIFRVAVKPTPSIALTQESVDLSTGRPVALAVAGRHDPCIVPRAVPCVEAAAAVAIYDAVLQQRKEGRP